MAKILNPAEYGRAFYTGAQAEFVVPRQGATGVSSLVIGYDAVWASIDLSFGLGIGGDAVTDESAPEVYIGGIRLGLPIHRGVRADFSLMAAGGVLLLDPPDGSIDAIGEAGAGGRFRVFITPNVAVVASVGIVALFRGDNSSLLLGARPLGSAAVVYFFR